MNPRGYENHAADLSGRIGDGAPRWLRVGGICCWMVWVAALVISFAGVLSSASSVRLRFASFGFFALGGVLVFIASVADGSWRD